MVGYTNFLETAGCATWSFLGIFITDGESIEASQMHQQGDLAEV